jgi:hypothetical protein
MQIRRHPALALLLALPLTAPVACGDDGASTSSNGGGGGGTTTGGPSSGTASGPSSGSTESGPTGSTGTGGSGVGGSGVGGSGVGGIGVGGSGVGGSGLGGSGVGGSGVGGSGVGGSGVGGSGAGGGEICSDLGVACVDGVECCSGVCDATAMVCTIIGACGESGDACDVGPDCCTFSCVDGECADAQCTADGQACIDDGECCGGDCTGDICVPLGNGCATSGNPCDDSSDCCSSFCSDGICAQPSYCQQSDDVCAFDGQCCSGSCNKEPNALLGLCGTVPAPGGGNCLPAGEVCGDGSVYDGGPLPVCGGECCSRACFPYGQTGVLICQPPSGCRPTGEVCGDDGDCCGSAGLPDGETSDVTCSKVDDNPLGRCDNGNSCTPAGGICRLTEIECNANANCCSGNTLQNPTCKQDNLGIPRCLAEEIDCTDPSIFVGQACASSADCCNLPCVPNPDGDPPFVCVGGCVPSDGTCTTSADCCAGIPCVVPSGQTAGVCDGQGDTSGAGGGGGGTGAGGEDVNCSEYGQSCSEDSDCCNGIPCSADGFCIFT